MEPESDKDELVLTSLKQYRKDLNHMEWKGYKKGFKDGKWEASMKILKEMSADIRKNLKELHTLNLELMADLSENQNGETQNTKGDRK